jgi:hypothetical protein
LPVDDDDSDGTLCPADGYPSCELLYFGSDRYDNSGDAQQGFWFLQDEVDLTGGPGGGGTHFDGVHLPGDLLVVSDFGNGGTTSTIKVWEWDPTCTKGADGCADNNLRIRAESDDANCLSGTLPDGDDFCGIVNPNDGTVAPWAFTDKSGNSTYLQGEFFEAGINLSTLDLADRCFATVVAESRSSTSATATLKDFVLGRFGECQTEVTTTPKDGSGADIPAEGIPIGAAANLEVRDEAVVDVPGIAVWQGTVQFYLCGPISAPDTCDSDGAVIGSPVNVDESTATVLSPDDAAFVTSAGRYCWRAEFTPGTPGVPNASDSADTECFLVNPLTPTLTTTAGDDVVLGNPVTDTATLSGTANSPGDNGPNATYPTINATNGAPAGGTITFTLIGPDDCVTLATGTGTNPQDVAVSGDDTYGPVSFTPDSAGDFHWQASYTGDAPNTESASHNGDCSDTNEDVTVLQLPTSMDTEQSFVPNDAATITVASGGGDLAGTVTFQLFVNDETCSGSPAYTSGAIDVTTGTGTGTSRTVTSDNTDAYDDDGDTFNWVVVYDGTNPGHKDVTSGCDNEHSSITIDNGSTVTSP